MNDQELMVISNYIEKYILKPKINGNFCFRSYAEWAANEIFDLVLEHPFIPAIMIVEGFWMHCGMLAAKSQAEKRVIFLIGLDVAADVLHMLQAI